MFLASLGGCTVPGLDLVERACPCASGWVCDEQTQRCIVDGTADSGPLDSTQVDGANAVTDGEVRHVTPGEGDGAVSLADPDHSNTTAHDAGQIGTPFDGSLVDAGRSDAATDASTDAGVVVPPPPDAGNPPPPDAGTEPCSRTLLPGEFRRMGDYLCSSNGRYYFGLSPEGDLELRTEKYVIWSAGICCGAALWMQRDGNMVVNDASGLPQFATNTRGKSGAFLSVEDDERAVLWFENTVIWSTSTK